MLAVWAGLSVARSSLFREVLPRLSCVFGPQLGWQGQRGPLSMGSHIVEEAIPSLFTWWQKGSEPQERTYCSNMQGLFQPLLVSYFLMSHWPQQAMSPRQNHWQGPSAGVDTGKHGGCRLLLQQFASRCLAGVSPEMKAAVLLSALFASAVLLSALFAFLLRMVSWDGCSQWIRCSAPGPRGPS